MKILLALAAFALLAVLVVSATMGADTLIPGGDPAKKPVGGLAPSGGKARLLPTSLSPPSIKGTGFKPGENVTIKLIDSPQSTRRAKASESGSFTIRMPERTNQCGGLTAVAVGDKGS